MMDPSSRRTSRWWLGERFLIEEAFDESRTARVGAADDPRKGIGRVDVAFSSSLAR
jgi:hypothetical protein